jgi:hypothetical protein
MKDEIVPHIAKILDLVTMWQTLKNLFEQWSGPKRLHLKINLTNLQLEERKSVINFQKWLKDIINHLANIREVVPEKYMVEQILNSLSESMESLSNILLY